MKKLISISALVLTFYSLMGQQVPLYTNYNFNLFGINPAVAGSQSCLDLRMGFRRQWLGLPGSPTTAFAGVHGSFGKKNFNFHGTGVVIETDDAGPLGYTSIKGAYAYHMKVNRRNMLSVGVGLGFLQYRIDRGQLDPNDANDPVYNNINQSQFLFPQVDFGFLYKNSERFIGFSIKNLTENNLEGIGLDSKFRRHIYLTAGRQIPLENKLFFKPSVNLRYISGSPIGADLTLLFNYNELFEFGAAFRGGHGISGLIKLDVLKYLTVGYSYDLTLNKLRLGTRHSHEIVLGIQACPRGSGKGIHCSAYD